MSDEDRERWDARWREEGALAPPEPFLTALDLPHSGRALDVAGGSGRNALWLARRGLSVTLADISPAALLRAREEAERAGLALETVELDLERDPPPRGPWDVILCFHYLQRALFDAWPQLLAPGGFLIFAQPTRKNLERHPRPPARFLLEEGELARLVRGLEILQLTEGWTAEGRHEARLVARRA